MPRVIWLSGPILLASQKRDTQNLKGEGKRTRSKNQEILEYIYCFTITYIVATSALTVLSDTDMLVAIDVSPTQ